MAVYCDVCTEAGSPNDDAGYTTNGGWLCPAHRQIEFTPEEKHRAAYDSDDSFLEAVALGFADRYTLERIAHWAMGGLKRYSMRHASQTEVKS